MPEQPPQRPAPTRLPDETAPPIRTFDRQRLLALARGQLPRRSQRALLRLISTYACWEVAYRLAVEEAERAR